MAQQVKRPRVKEGDLLWEPSGAAMSRANITRFMDWLKTTRGLSFDGHHELWQWSVTDIGGFWAAIAEFFEVAFRAPYSTPLAESRMPGARWFPGAELNYAEHALRRSDGDVALLAHSEARPASSMTSGELQREVAAVSAGLRALGVKRGDRVAAYMPNIPETVIAFLATAGIGGIWSACSPDFGSPSVVDRFKQIEPKVLFAVDGYRYGGRDFSRLDRVAEIQRQLPTLKHTVVVPYLDQALSLDGLAGVVTWDEFRRPGDGLTFEPVPFEHPLWVLYSSGTTGLPKAIVQGHGGILLEHMKVLSLHMDLTDGDRFFWFTTTGWMMWNLLVGGLLLGTTVLLYDGHPGHPDTGALWRFAEETEMTYFGASAPYIHACMNAGLEPGRDHDLSRLKGVGSTGAPLSPEGFQWVYDEVGPDLLLNSFSGGTDLCTGFVGSCPVLPVRSGEIQCRCLGARVEAFDEDGRSVTDQVGELVITEPMPSMPLYLWGDDDGSRYRDSYFQMFPGVWRHGDWIKITDRQSCVIYGRSDSTLNRGGVRMGTNELYRVVDGVDEVEDSLAVDTGQPGSEGRLLLFVVLRGGTELDDALRDSIRAKLRRDLSPRHVPDDIYAVSEVPTTLNGKKLEVPVKRLLNGVPMDEAISRDAMGNPESLNFFVELARERVTSKT